MLSYLRQATASQVRHTPPFLDSGDYLTAETGLTIANTDVKLIQGGVVTNKNSGGGTHTANGVYALTFNATDTATVGELMVSIQVVGATPTFMKFWVLTAECYDSLFGANAIGMSDDAITLIIQSLLANFPVLRRSQRIESSAMILAKQYRGFTRDVELTTAAGATVIPQTGDKVRAVIGRASDISPESLSGAKLVVVSGENTANGSSFTKNSPESGKNRLRIDGSDLTFTPGTYTLYIDFYDDADGDEWKNVQRHVFTLEPT